MDYSTDRNAWLCESLYEEIEDRLLSILSLLPASGPYSMAIWLA